MVEADVAVIGAGIAGSAAALSLADAGRSVVIFEQFEAGHKRGSSHGTSRIFRFSYDDPDFVRMAMEALPMWRAIEERSGNTLLTVTGGLDSGPHVDSHAKALETCDAEFEIIDAAEVSRRWPDVRVSPEHPVLWQPDAGFIAADAAVATLVDLAADAGAAVHYNEPVERLQVTNDKVLIETSGDEYRVGTVVGAAGAWAKPLLHQVGVDLPVTASRETVAYYSIGDDVRLPTLVDQADGLFYGLPAPGLGIKTGIHHGGPDTDPDEVGQISTETIERVSKWVAERYPSADPNPVHAETCLYTNTSDERFIFERHGPIVVGSACSGHGFKFGPVTGKRLAELLLT